MGNEQNAKAAQNLTGKDYLAGCAVFIGIIFLCCYGINSCNSVDQKELRNLEKQIDAIKEQKENQIEALKKQNAAKIENLNKKIQEQKKEIDFLEEEINKNPQAKAKVARIRESRRQGELPDQGLAWVQAQYAVEAKLQNPKSAKFEYGGSRKVEINELSRIFIFRSYVDAKNAFSADVRTYFFIKLRHWNGKWEVLQLTFDNKPF